jgi:hypothetical protein
VRQVHSERRERKTTNLSGHRPTGSGCRFGAGDEFRPKSPHHVEKDSVASRARATEVQECRAKLLRYVLADPVMRAGQLLWDGPSGGSSSGLLPDCALVILICALRPFGWSPRACAPMRLSGQARGLNDDPETASSLGAGPSSVVQADQARGVTTPYEVVAT